MTIATIYCYRTGEELRDSTPNECADYMWELFAGDLGDPETPGAVDGERYGFPGRTVYMAHERSA